MSVVHQSPVASSSISPVEIPDSFRAAVWPSVTPTDPALIIAGSRSFGQGFMVAASPDDPFVSYVAELVESFPISPGTVISGGARGADGVAAAYADTFDHPLLELTPVWGEGNSHWDDVVDDVSRDQISEHDHGSEYLPVAGHWRNQLMAELAATRESYGLLCLWDGSSPGTAGMASLADELWPDDAPIGYALYRADDDSLQMVDR